MRRPEDPPPFFYWSGRSELPLTVGADGSLRLPEVILWAFGLQEGDLLPVCQDALDGGRYFFKDHIQAVRTIAQAARTIPQALGHPWPYIEELLRLPMASLDSFGTLLLPENASSLHGLPGEVRRLVVEPRSCQGSFSLEPAERAFAPRLCLEITYVLPAEKEHIRLPADLSSIARLEGTLLACETRLGLVDLEVAGSSESLGNRTLVSVGPKGLLALPEAFLRDRRPEWGVRLSARIAPELSFQLSYYLG
jgi:hypothetical protein